MNNMRIVEIPASMRENAGRKNTVRKLRVAAYCRVSTEEEEQQGSFEIQKLYYTEKINSTPEWEVAGIYADDGISGVHTKKRDGFNQMIQDCKKHRIDLILTKSISRFARNTLDSIQYVRMLKQMGIAVVFEKENINTATMNSEMILTVLSAFAQAESESISQNVARGKRMGYKHGKFAFPYGRIIGYRKGADGKPEIVPEQAEIIRLIFNSYLQGDSLQSIKAKLETAGALTARGNTAWSAQSIQRILQNEKYCGDVLLQKTFTEDVLTGVHKKNTGQLPQYYIENFHEGIVSKQMFREVQTEIARRNSKSAANQRKRRRGRYNSKYALSERLFCGDCGSPYKRVTWNIHGRKQIVWRCVNRIEYGTKFCGSSPSIPEEELHRAILKAVQDLKWGIRKRMQSGTYVTASTPFGYRQENRKLIPYEPEALVVRFIYAQYLAGESVARITKLLNSQYPKEAGAWNPPAVQSILTNEKYRGDTCCQKRYTPDTLPLQKKRNKSQLPKYYIQESHPAIVMPTDFEKVQALLSQKRTHRSQMHSYPLTKMAVCQFCGKMLSPKTHANGVRVWNCKTHIVDSTQCPIKPVYETELYGAFLSMYNKLFENRATLFLPIFNDLQRIQDIKSMQNEASNTVHTEILQISKQLHNLTRMTMH